MVTKREKNHWYWLRKERAKKWEDWKWELLLALVIGQKAGVKIRMVQMSWESSDYSVQTSSSLIYVSHLCTQLSCCLDNEINLGLKTNQALVSI